MRNNYNCGDSRCQPIDITPPVYLTRIIVSDRTLKLKGEPMMKHYIYKTTNLITKKFYIGKHSSQNIEIDTYLGSGILLERAIKKYGKHNFKK